MPKIAAPKSAAVRSPVVGKGGPRALAQRLASLAGVDPSVVRARAKLMADAPDRHSDAAFVMKDCICNRHLRLVGQDGLIAVFADRKAEEGVKGFA